MVVTEVDALSNQARITGTVVPTRVDSEVAQEAYRALAFELDVERVESMRLSFSMTVPDGTRLRSSSPVSSSSDAIGWIRAGELPTARGRRATAYADNAGGSQEPLKLIAKYLVRSI